MEKSTWTMETDVSWVSEEKIFFKYAAVFLVFVVVVVAPSPSTKWKTTEEEFAISEMRVKKVGCKLQECVVHIDDCKEEACEEITP